MTTPIVCVRGDAPSEGIGAEVRSRLARDAVVVATSAERLEETLESGRCGAVILDADARSFDWREAARSIRSRFPHVATVIFARDGRNEHASEAFREDVDGFATPATLASLAATLAAARKRAVARSEGEHVRAAADFAADYAYSIAIDSAGRAVPDWISSGYERIAGCPPRDGGVGLGFDGIVHPDDAAIAVRREANLRAGRTSVEEFRVVARSGEVRRVRDRALAVIDARSGRVVRVAGGAHDVTDFHRANEERAALRARLEAILEQMPAGVVIAESPSGRTIEFNKLAEEIIGAPVPKDAGGFAAGIPLARSIRTGEPVREKEIEIPRSDGSLGVLRFSATPVRRGDGKIVETVATFSDVTDASQVEQSLHESESRFRTMFQSAAVGIVLTDLRGSVIESNPEFKRILGISSERLAGMRFPEFVGLADFQRAERLHEKLLDGSLPSLRFEAAYAWDGAPAVRAAVTSSFVRGDGTKPTHAIAFVADVSEQRAAEAAHLKAAGQIRRLADALPVLISYVRADGRYDFVNRTYEKWFGIPLEEIRDRRVTELLPPEIHDVLLPYILRALAGERVTFEPSFRDRKGRLRHLEVTYLPDAEPDGRIRGYFALASDVTERRKAERVRRRLTARLAKERSIFHKVLQQMPAGLVVARAPSGRLVLRNNRVMEMVRHAYRPTESVSEYGQWSGFHADGRKIEPEEWPLARAIRTGEEVRGETIHYLRGDGTKAILSVDASPVRDRKRSIVAGVATVIDVTAEREREAAMQAFARELERRNVELKTLLDVIPIGIAIAEDPECQRIRLNWYVLSLLGIPERSNYSCSAPPDERPPWRFFRGERELAPEELPLQRAAATRREILGHVMDFEFAPGRRVRIMTNASPLLDESGAVRGSVAAFLPIDDPEPI